MESIAQFLSSLKENEKAILVTIIANALTIYLLCFAGIEKFNTYLWYQQLVIPCSLSIIYTTSFYFTIIILFGIFSMFKGSKGICSFLMENNYKWYFCIFSLCNISTLIEITLTLTDKSHEFSISQIMMGTAFALLGITLLMALYAIFGDKNTPKN